MAVVRLYYLGGLIEDGAVRPITSLGRAFVLPNTGEYLDVEEVYAQDLQRRFNVGATYFTREQRVAERVKRGESAQVSPDGIVDVSELSEDQLLAELNRRKQLAATIEAVTVMENELQNQKPEFEIAATTGKRGK